MKRVCVFCASSMGARPEYELMARALGESIAARGCEVVFGGGHIGLMGVLADAALARGGRVIGVIPQSLMDRELGHRGLSDLRIVSSMHERKAVMAELSDAFIALPGGYGTLEEFCEVLTWAQLGMHRKPFGLLNVAGYYDHFLAFLDHAVAEKLLKPKHRALLVQDEEPVRLLERLAEHLLPPEVQWIRPGEE